MKLSPEYINNRLLPYTQSQNIYVAYSGGIDSHVLLHLCANSKKLSGKIIAVHIHHGLQAAADAWSQHCQQIATQLKVEFILKKVNAQASAGASPEEVARNARYQALAELLKQGDLLLTAQHLEDQYETILLQMLRGAGLSGLSGMPERMSLGQGLLLRPLLAAPKQAVQDYAQQQQLTWIEDNSNQCDDFDRNYLRNQISPLIKARWPSADKTISRAGKHCVNAEQFIEQMIQPLFLSVYCAKHGSLAINKLKMQDQYCQHLLIRHWFKVLNLRMPSTRFIEQLLTDVIDAKPDAQPYLAYQNSNVRRYRDNLYWQDNTVNIDLSADFIWPSKQLAFDLPDNGRLARVNTTEPGISELLWQQTKVKIAYRQGGERIRLPSRDGHHTLKKLFQEAGIPPWQRSNTPLIFLDGKLAAIADLWISREFFQESGANNTVLHWCSHDRILSL